MVRPFRASVSTAYRSSDLTLSACGQRVPPTGHSWQRVWPWVSSHDSFGLESQPTHSRADAQRARAVVVAIDPTGVRSHRGPPLSMCIGGPGPACLSVLCAEPTESSSRAGRTTLARRTPFTFHIEMYTAHAAGVWGRTPPACARALIKGVRRARRTPSIIST